MSHVKKVIKLKENTGWKYGNFLINNFIFTRDFQERLLIIKYFKK